MLPAGVLIGFAAGAVAALGAVVVFEPRLVVPTWTETALTDSPSAVTISAAAISPEAIVALAPPPAEAQPQAFAGLRLELPQRTAAEAPPAIVAEIATVLRGVEEWMTAGPTAPRQEVLAPVRIAAGSPLAPEYDDGIPPLALRGATAEPLAAPVEPAAPIAAGLAEAGASTGADAQAAPFTDRDLRLIVHAPTSISGADLDTALTLLSGAVAPPEGPIRVNYAISSSNVRYYHAADADAAIAAAQSLSDRLGPVEARDFTSYQPRPASGTIEVWLSGTPGTPARTAPDDDVPAGRAGQAVTRLASGREPRVVVTGIPNLVQSVVQDQPVVEGIPSLVESVVQNQATQSAIAARAAAQAADAARRERSIGNVLRRAIGAP